MKKTLPTVLLMLLGAASPLPTKAAEHAAPLCAEFSTVFGWDNRELISDAPGLVKLPDGTLLGSVQLWSRDVYQGADKLAQELFWMTSNQVTGMATETWRGWGKERRFLMLHYSRDAQNWFPAGVLAMWPRETQSFNYCTPVIDGANLLFVSRTSENSANQHDNDRITFHRLPNFRNTAVDLKPRIGK